MGGRLTRLSGENRAVTGDELVNGLRLMRAGEFFAAHEELEVAWRAAPAAERDFYQGLVHVAVAWYQAGRGRPVACASQLDKARRRLAAFAPEHRGVDVAGVVAQVDAAAEVVAGGSLELAPLRI
jgi:predicted metal-dependent hydrolase